MFFLKIQHCTSRMVKSNSKAIYIYRNQQRFEILTVDGTFAPKTSLSDPKALILQVLMTFPQRKTVGGPRAVCDDWSYFTRNKWPKKNGKLGLSIYPIWLNHVQPPINGVMNLLRLTFNLVPTLCVLFLVVW